MSHFTVMVVTDSPEKEIIDAALAPFVEHDEDPESRKYMKFESREEEITKEYQEGTVTMVRLPVGEKSNLDEVYRGRNNFVIDGFTYYYDHDMKETPEGGETLEVPFSTLFATVEEYAAQFCGYENRDPETRQYGHWRNPNAKWDWYQIGGRWSSMLKVKPGATDVGHGNPSLLMSSDDIDLDGVDQCRVGDLDLVAMKADAIERRTHSFTEFFKTYQKNGGTTEEQAIIDLHQFADICDGFRRFLKTPEGKDKSLSSLIDENKEASILRDRTKHHFWLGIPERMVSKEAWIAAAPAFSTFAVLLEGKWYERGKMGWWAIVHDEKSEGDWETEFNTLLSSLPPEKYITIVDCHI